MKTKALLFAVLLWACGDPERGYIIHMEIDGTPAAFTGRSVEVQGMAAPAPVPKTGAPGLLTTEVTLCTRDRSAFLERSIPVRVLAGDMVLWDGAVARVACRLARSDMGDEEHNILTLREDGTIATDFGGDPGAFATCFPPPGHPLICRQPSF